MKKLMIAAAIVCAAAVSQAASLAWSSYAFHNDGEADEDWFTGGQGYLVLVTSADTFGVTTDDAGNFTITGGTLLTGEGSRNAYEGGYTGGAIDGSAWSAEDGAKYAFAIVATDNGTSAGLPTDGLYGVDGIYEVTWNKDTGASFMASEDHMAAVVNQVAAAPEPTSGLLLLLGVAGLALRRRRA